MEKNMRTYEGKNTNNKVQLKLDIDMDSGDYEIKFHNLSHPGESIDYSELQKLLSQVLTDFSLQINTGIDSDEQITKEIH